jgi:PleD family two-component response regulator
MAPTRLQILHIEDDTAAARLVAEQLAASKVARFEIDRADRLDSGIEFLATKTYDVVLLDLFLPDSQGLKTYARVRERAPGTPIVLLTGYDNVNLESTTMKEGAEDFLVKGQVPGPALARALCHAVLRHRRSAGLRSGSGIDSRTGLLDGPGFRDSVARHWKRAVRRGTRFVIVVAEIEGGLSLLEMYGREELNRTVSEAVGILRLSIRDSDVLGRCGEFTLAALAPDADRGEAIQSRINALLEDQTPTRRRPVALKLAVRVLTADPKTGPPPPEWLPKV